MYSLKLSHYSHYLTSLVFIVKLYFQIFQLQIIIIKKKKMYYINITLFIFVQELLGLDLLHKFIWVRLLARMFEAMAGNFAYSGDIHLFLNVLNGAVTLHSEDSCILRYVMATYINAARNFKNIFSSNG